MFLQFTGADRNIVFYDTTTHQILQAHRVDFYETYFHESRAPPYAQKLKTIAKTAIANKEIDDMFMNNYVRTKSFSKVLQHSLVVNYGFVSTDGEKVFSV